MAPSVLPGHTGRRERQFTSIGTSSGVNHLAGECLSLGQRPLISALLVVGSDQDLMRATLLLYSGSAMRSAAGADFFFFFLGGGSTTVLSHWISPMGKIGLFYQGKASCDRVALPNLRCIPGVLVYLIHRTLTWATGSITCTQLSVHAITHGGLRTHVRESALNGDWEKNPLPHRGIEPA